MQFGCTQNVRCRATANGYIIKNVVAQGSDVRAVTVVNVIRTVERHNAALQIEVGGCTCRCNGIHIYTTTVGGCGIVREGRVVTVRAWVAVWFDDKTEENMPPPLLPAVLPVMVLVWTLTVATVVVLTELLARTCRLH